MHISNDEIFKAIQKFKKYPIEKQKNIEREIARIAFEIDAKQKNKLRFHSSSSGRNYSSMINANRVVIKKGMGVVNIANGHKAAGYFEFGTRKHPIVVRNKKVLATLNEYSSSFKGRVVKDKQGNNWRVFGKKVDHPGTKPKPFFYHPVLVASKTYTERIKKVLEV